MKAIQFWHNFAWRSSKSLSRGVKCRGSRSRSRWRFSDEGDMPSGRPLMLQEEFRWPTLRRSRSVAFFSSLFSVLCFCSQFCDFRFLISVSVVLSPFPARRGLFVRGEAEAAGLADDCRSKLQAAPTRATKKKDAGLKRSATRMRARCIVPVQERRGRGKERGREIPHCAGRFIPKLKRKRDSSHPQADCLGGARREERASACSLRNDVVSVRIDRDTERGARSLNLPRRSNHPDVIPSVARNPSFVFAAFFATAGCSSLSIGDSMIRSERLFCCGARL